jgi:hypothetical protein
MISDHIIDRHQIIRAAEGMISNHGSDALAVANKRAHHLRFQGLDATSTTWVLVGQAIEDLQVTDPNVKGVHSRSREECFAFEKYCD